MILPVAVSAMMALAGLLLGALHFSKRRRAASGAEQQGDQTLQFKFAELALALRTAAPEQC